jgi:two-component system cell cycle sensor histidine kinase/response regulator CckA
VTLSFRTCFSPTAGLGTFMKLHTHYPDIPVIVLTALDDITLTIKAMQEGAQDYLVKGQFDGEVLVRSMWS